MKAGRKKSSTALELRERGDYRPSRHGDREGVIIEPDPMSVPLCPENLPDAARDVWDRNIEAAINSGRLSAVDADALADYCRVQAFIECKVANGEMPAASYFAEARKKRELMGMEGPRSRIGLVVEQPKKNAFERNKR